MTGRRAPAIRMARSCRWATCRSIRRRSPPPGTRMTEEALCVIARAAERFVHRDIHVPGDARQQQAALDLRARHRLFVSQWPERAAPDRERQPIPAHRAEPRAHLGQRRRHPSHRAAAKRVVAREGGREPVSRQHAEQQPGGGAGVAAVEHLVRTAKAPRSGDADDAAQAERRDLRAELAQHPCARARIERRQRATDKLCPRASAPKRSARWVMLLSPGTRTLPCTFIGRFPAGMPRRARGRPSPRRRRRRR